MLARLLLASTLLHAALLALVALAVLGMPLPAPPREHLIEVGEIALPRMAPGGGRARAGAPRAAPSLGLSPFHFAGAPGPLQGQVPRDLGLDAFESARVMSLEEQSRLEPFVRALWHEIDQATAYPDVLVRNRAQGPVTVELVVDGRGVFTGDFRGAEAEDPVLKTYVLSVLAYALDEPLPAAARADRPFVALVAHFDFNIFTVGHTPAPREYDAVKNVLSFNREAWATPRLNDLIDDFFKKVPPIIPIPGGAYIDFVRAYEFAARIGKPEKLSREASDAVQLEQARARWKSVIHRREEAQETKKPES